MSARGVALERRWECPHRHCDSWAVTRDGKTPYHMCAQTAGLRVPLVPAGTRGEHRLVEREDYVGREVVQLVEGRPVMAVQTVRDEGADCTVLAPCAGVGVGMRG